MSLGLTEEEVGLFFCIAACFYLIGNLIVLKIGSDRIEKKTWMVCGLILATFGHLMLGPS
jgi:predicted MFS family arabinose efflux permease